MELIDRKMVISLDMKDCERILSWYKSEQDALIKGNVNEEWKKEQNITSIYNKLRENYHLAYQFGKVPRWGDLDPMIKTTELLEELSKVYEPSITLK